MKLQKIMLKILQKNKTTLLNFISGDYFYPINYLKQVNKKLYWVFNFDTNNHDR